MPNFDWFIPEQLYDDFSLLRRARLVIGAAVSLAVCYLVGLVARMAIGFVPTVSILIAIGAIVMLAAAPLLLRFTGSLTATGNVVSYCGGMSLIGIAYMAGGLESPILTLLPIVPFFTSIVVDARSGILQAVLIAAAIVVLLLLPLLGVPLPSPPEPEVATKARALFYLIALALMASFGYVYLREQKRAERTILSALGELEKKNTELESFAYTVSHDLKSPLLTIKGFLGLLERDLAAENQEAVENDMAMISRATGTMQHLVDDLLDLSRIRRNANDWTEYSLAVVAREVVELISGRLEAHGAEVAVSPELPRVMGDRTLLGLIFQNLIENAVKFARDGQPARIEVGAREDDGHVVVFVADNGQGIAPQHQDRIFGLFAQLRSEADGTGIGLATVARAVDMHGGRIWVESEGAGRGSTFCFTLSCRASGAPS